MTFGGIIFNFGFNYNSGFFKRTGEILANMCYLTVSQSIQPFK